MAVMWPITTAAAAAATAENYRDHRRDSQLTTDTSHYHQRVALATRASRAASFSRCRMHSILDMDMGIKSHVKSSRCQVMSQVAKSSSCSPGSHLNKNKNIAGNSPPLVPCAGQFAPQAKYCALHWLPIAIGGDAQTLGARRSWDSIFESRGRDLCPRARSPPGPPTGEAPIGRRLLGSGTPRRVAHVRSSQPLSEVGRHISL
jgi:hypothetical protein